MAGYHNFSMSNNAVSAYNNGEKPKSKFKKTDFINFYAGVDEYFCALIERLDIRTLKECLLSSEGWHHTSKHFNCTDFFSIKEFDEFSEELEEVTTALVTYNNSLKKEKEEVVTRAKCKFLTWSGTRNHPHATEHKKEGVIKGGWFFPDGEKFKKSTSSNGFEILERL